MTHPDTAYANGDRCARALMGYINDGIPSCIADYSETDPLDEFDDWYLRDDAGDFPQLAYWYIRAEQWKRAHEKAEKRIAYLEGLLAAEEKVNDHAIQHRT